MRRLSIVTALLFFAYAAAAQAAGWQGSFNQSYQQASPGETIVVPAGTYPAETIGSRGALSAPVTFTMGGPVTVNGTLRLDGAQNLTLSGGGQLQITYLLIFGGVNVIADGIDGTHFDIFDTPGPVTITSGDWGPCQAPRDDPSCLSRIGSGNNVLIEGNAFHNITSTDLANYHVDGMAVFGGANNIVKRNRYYGNFITNIRVQNCCGNPAISNLLIEGNTFQAATSGQGARNANGIDIDSTVPGLKIKFNSFEQGTYIQNTAPSNQNAEYTGNLYTHVSCLSGVTYSYNVFVPYSEGQGQQACSSTDTKATTLGYALFPGMASGAPGTDKGGNSCATVDIDGNQRPRGAACDAGAVEAGGVITPPKPACADGIDNDGDGKTDYPADPGCTSSTDTSEADAVPTCPGQGQGLVLTRLSQTTSTITFGWAAPAAEAIGYRFSSSAAPGKVSVTWDATRNSVKFAKGAAGTCYFVGAVLAGPSGGSSG